ncbi:META domain-containing protein [Paucihalobacter ruber]|uniref:META domain-containing protein n=1 Tax=Paucihalobacter ruber TaxID=2567861 RepID=A0A506PNH0_9FLAO|nr:copper resistance protein NlpE N-terminal domain-containing protein [Paucihalobacter ruber]TPV34765.1 META domain-containing protein [Paucihalobacter ruber]
MNTRKILNFSLIGLLLVMSCNDKAKQENQPAEPAMEAAPVPDAATSKNSLDWNGTYQGTLPCADCEGIATALTLNNDLTFKHQSKYLGKSDSIFVSTGSFKWNDKGSDIALTDTDGTVKQFKVGENQLFMLDQEGNRITGDLAEKYILKKDQVEITEKYWKLVELNGQPVTTGKGNREAYLILKSENNRAHGNGSCNMFNGNYELMEGNRIKFSKMASTLMACQDMETERNFMNVLETADNYNLTETTLVLNKARMAPLARFEVVYLY